MYKSIQYFCIWSAPKNSPKRAKSITHLVELLEYREYEDCCDGDRRLSSTRNRRLATQPFQARVRLNKSSSGSANSSHHELPWGLQSHFNIEDRSPSLPDSPSSFPDSPDARARHMSVADVEVDSVIFRARDRLRLETQSASSDAVSRRAASRVLEDGRNIAFDQRFALQDTFLVRY